MHMKINLTNWKYKRHSLHGVGQYHSHKPIRVAEIFANKTVLSDSRDQTLPPMMTIHLNPFTDFSSAKTSQIWAKLITYWQYSLYFMTLAGFSLSIGIAPNIPIEEGLPILCLNQFLINDWLNLTPK